MELVFCVCSHCGSLVVAYLVSLLGSLGSSTLDGLRDVVGGVLDGLHFD